jgi:hypothetical protein
VKKKLDLLAKDFTAWAEERQRPEVLFPAAA